MVEGRPEGAGRPPPPGGGSGPGWDRRDRPAPDGGAGKAPEVREEGGGKFCRGPRLLRRGGGEDLRRGRPCFEGKSKPRHQAASGGCRHHIPLELPRRPPRLEAGPGPRRQLHRRRQAFQPHAAGRHQVRGGAGRGWPPPGSSTSSTVRGGKSAESWWRAPSPGRSP